MNYDKKNIALAPVMEIKDKGENAFNMVFDNEDVAHTFTKDDKMTLIMDKNDGKT